MTCQGFGDILNKDAFFCRITNYQKCCFLWKKGSVSEKISVFTGLQE